MVRWKLMLFCASPLLAQLALPPEPQATRFAVIGDMGNGRAEQYQVAGEMAERHKEFPFDFVLMVGDNILGRHNRADYQKKFETPYRPMLEGGVRFYAALGNHDDAGELLYKPFNMEGKRYYSFRKGTAEFFALDSTHMDARQLSWLATQLRNSAAVWKICYFHHPLYSEGKFHGPSTALRGALEPVLDKYGVQVVFSGHEHVYERIKPHNGVNYFIVGNSGQLRAHGLRPSQDTAKGFDTDRTFLLGEIAGNHFYFQAISRTGETVDRGMLTTGDATDAGKTASSAGH